MKFATLLVLLLAYCFIGAVHCLYAAPCGGSDCVVYHEVQGSCKEVTRVKTSDCKWIAGLYPYTDFQQLKGGKIAAYQIQWFSGTWSGWYVPGVNDIDSKFNNPISSSACFDPADVSSGATKTLRRMWSYFYDHTHKFIVCYNA